MSSFRYDPSRATAGKWFTTGNWIVEDRTPGTTNPTPENGDSVSFDNVLLADITIPTSVTRLASVAISNSDGNKKVRTSVNLQVSGLTINSDSLFITAGTQLLVQSAVPVVPPAVPLPALFVWQSGMIGGPGTITLGFPAIGVWDPQVNLNNNQDADVSLGTKMKIGSGASFTSYSRMLCSS